MSQELTEAIGQIILGEIDPADQDTQLDVVRRAAAAGAITAELLHRSVTSARAGGHSWQAVGDALGMSRQAAQQRFGREHDGTEPAGSPEAADERWLGPVTAFDEMAELDLAGRLGWHTVAAGMLRHRVVRTDTQWEHKRVVWGTTKAERDGWQVGARAFPWVYLIRDTGRPAAT